ncbi:MAG: hypothetical protein GQ546_03865 [Gammaproteobacteria bacterium]|nr:hypothetical protein [Gammaproteobacteria bacterium]
MTKSTVSIRKSCESFSIKNSHDLTSYEYGTENLEGDDAINVAIIQNQGLGLDGSSFIAVQQWVHDLDKFQSMNQTQQDHTIGRRLSDNEEIEDTPESAHVNRTVQEETLNRKPLY